MLTVECAVVRCVVVLVQDELVPAQFGAAWRCARYGLVRGGAALSAHRACVICDFDCVEFVEVVLPVSAVSVTLDTGHCATGHAPQCPECGEIADAVESFFIL